MVQREVGERLAAAPGSGAYGVPSVLAQLACEVEVLRAIPRTRLLSRAERRLGARGAASLESAGTGGGDGLPAQLGSRRGCRCARSSRGAFAHRRKTLAGSLALAGGERAGRSREQVRAALVKLGHPADVRAERLAPRGLPRARARCSNCERERSSPALRALAPAKINLGPVRRAGARRDGRHELVSVMQSISLADELTLEPRAGGASTTRSSARAWQVARRRTSRRRRLQLFRERPAGMRRRCG